MLTVAKCNMNNHSHQSVVDSTWQWW